MLQGVVIRGTTPEHKFEIPYDVSLVKNIRVTYGQNGTVHFTKTLSECKLENGELSVQLTQEETFQFIASKKLNIEIRILLTNNKVVRTEDPIVLKVIDTIDTEVMY